MCNRNSIENSFEHTELIMNGHQIPGNIINVSSSIVVGLLVVAIALVAEVVMAAVLVRTVVIFGSSMPYDG